MLGSAVEKFLLANPFIAATTNTTIVGAVTMTDTTLFSTTTADPNANTLGINKLYDSVMLVLCSLLNAGLFDFNHDLD